MTYPHSHNPYSKAAMSKVMLLVCEKLGQSQISASITIRKRESRGKLRMAAVVWYG